MKSTSDLVQLRWRVAQWFLALSDGNGDQAAALVKAMRVEGIAKADILDEFRLLRAEFGHRQRYHLVAEITRLWRQLARLCVRCGRPSRHLDNAHICHRCILDEARP